MTREELRLLQLCGQHLTAPTDMLTATQDLLGFQAQFLSNALHALRLRSADYDLERAEETLVKSWTIRGTMHLFAPEDLPLFLHEGRAHALRSRDTLESDERASAERKAFFAALIRESVGNGLCTREELKAACFANGMTETEAESLFDPWGGLIRALCENGMLCHRALEKKSYALCPPFTPMDREAAETELLRRYFEHFGPATLRDAAYFFGKPQAWARFYLERLPLSELECEGKRYFHIPGETPTGEVPACIFLAGFDQLLLGYEKTESLYLPPEHLRGIFNRAGIVMPAVLLRGRVVGRWKRERKTLHIALFESVRAADRKQIQRSAAALWGKDLKPVFD